MKIEKKNSPLDNLDNIENIKEELSEEELKLLNIVFNEIEEFNQITDNLEKALASNIINHFQLTKIFKIITKTVYYKISLNRNLYEKKGLMRTFFELPEIISKRVQMFLNRSRDIY